MRRRRIVGAALLIVGAGVAALGAPWREPPARLPVGGIALFDATGPVPKATAADGLHPLDLVAAALDPADLEALGSAIEEAADELAFRESPLYLDLGEPPAQDAMLAALRDYVPIFQAAGTLARGQWYSADRHWVAVAVKDCDDAGRTPPPVYCESLRVEAPRDGAQARLARFLSWPLSGGAIVAVSEPAEAVRLRRTLRKNLTQSKFFGLVLGGPPDSNSIPEGFVRAVRRLHERRRAFEGSQPALFALLFRDPLGPRAEWALPHTVLFIAPRLSALARLDEMKRAIEAAARSSHVDLEWLKEPYIGASPGSDE